MLDSLKTQIGGDHYKRMKIQPAEYILANDLGKYEADVIEKISRWKSKGGIEDLKKAQQAIQIIIDYHQKKDNPMIDSEHQETINAARKAEKDAASEQAQRQPLRA